MELVTQHRIFYSNKELVPLGEIAESLIALESIIKQTPHVLENIFPGTNIISVNVFIDELKSGSIYEDIVVKFIFGSQRRLDEFINSTRKILGMEHLINKPKLFSAIVLSIVLIGGINTLKKNVFSNPEDIKKLEIHNKVTVTYGASLAQMSPEEFKVLIENSIKDKDKITKNSIKLLLPAKRDREASISFDETPDLTMTPGIIEAMPSFAKEEEPEETLEDYKNIEIVIRATDLDSQKRGWAAVVPSVHKKRTRLQLDPTINPETLMTKNKIVGDVTIVFTYDENENKIPKIIYLRKLLK